MMNKEKEPSPFAVGNGSGDDHRYTHQPKND